MRRSRADQYPPRALVPQVNDHTVELQDVALKTPLSIARVISAPEITSGAHPVFGALAPAARIAQDRVTAHIAPE